MKKNFDVIIIGAGPAGLECARHLKDTDLSVLIIEKNEVIGNKICAGGLTGLIKEFDIPEYKTRNFAEQKIFIKEKEYKFTLANPIKTIARYDLGQYQLQSLDNSKNISILTNTIAKKVNGSSIIVNNGDTFHFKYLIGADGSNSIVRKHLGLKSKYCIGLYYEISEIKNDFIWYVNPEKLKSGYIWEFPHQNCTNVGIYFNPKLLNSNQAKEYLEQYLFDQGYSFEQKDLKGSLINYHYQGHQFDNMFLIGDASGLASKGTGEGISFALTSGKEIAKKIIDPSYQTVGLDRILKIKRRQERMFENFEAFPIFQNFFFWIFVNLMKMKWFQVYFGN